MSNLLASPSSFEALFTQSLDMVMVLDAEQIVTAINPAGASLLQQPLATLVGKSVDALCTDGALSGDHRMLLQALSASAQWCLSHQQPHRDRHRLHALPTPQSYDFTYTPVVGADGNTAQVLIMGRTVLDPAIATSPTSPKPADTASPKAIPSPFHQKLLFLERVMDSIPQGVFWKDRDAVYRWCNRSWAKLVGLADPGDIVGKTDHDLPWQHNETDTYQHHDLTILQSGVAQCDRLTVRRWANGKEIWFTSNKLPWKDAEGTVQGLLCTFEPITEYRRAVELKESKDLLQLVLDNIPQLLFWKDRKCRYLGCNQNWALAAGIGDPNAVVGKTDEEIWSSEEAQLYREQDEAVMASGIPVMHLIEQQHQADKVAWIDVNKIPIRDAEGNVIGVLGTIEDITERKQAEIALIESEAKLREQTEDLEQTLRELKQTQVQLIQTEKMSSLGQLVAGVAHEINNPVNFIHGNLSHARQYAEDLITIVDLYRQHYPDPPPEIATVLNSLEFDFLREDLVKLLNSMSTGTDRIRKIVLSLRNFSRLDESAIKDADIHDGLESTLTILQGQLKGGSKGHSSPIQIIRQYHDIPKITCYASQLNQVFMNILVNAIDALQERDAQRSPVECSANPSTITITTVYLCDRNRIQVRIHDNGPGIPASARDRIFDPFYTTKAVGKGTGLGLSISYQIVVEKHNGTLTCHSTPDFGTEFCIELPIQ
ncbi:MAG: PAS domain-containing protein [Leptolyngbyaceae cyanobacterium T60_A2020_046]|nr:PAS domain-containing protein [Leptolyngbyaceae cyanobacterium T60_A2020_046]